MACRISIHLMLWFNLVVSRGRSMPNEISIHLMLWFNFTSLYKSKVFWGISIHLMLWFNKVRLSKVYKEPNFNTSYVVVQPGYFDLYDKSGNDFNTSYVVVQPFKLVNFGGVFLISIHLMLWFNFLDLVKSYLLDSFQYILCCGSTIFVTSLTRLSILFQYILCCGSTSVS